jgi:hypothetical protein
MFTESKKKIQGKDAIPGKILPENIIDRVAYSKL